jgi:hypothetical protein
MIQTHCLTISMDVMQIFESYKCSKATSTSSAKTLTDVMHRCTSALVLPVQSQQKSSQMLCNHLIATGQNP